MGLAATWENDLGPGLFHETMGHTARVYLFPLSGSRQTMVSELEPVHPSHWLGHGGSAPGRRCGCGAWLAPVCPSTPTPALVCSLEGQALREPSQAPTPPSGRLAGGGLRCSRAEKRCPAAAAMLQENAVLSAVLDRTMFRFHRSTTWLDQAQRKAPRRPVRVKVRKQRQREDRSVQRKQRGEAEAGAGPHGV